jgi:hypothetical protein
MGYAGHSKLSGDAVRRLTLPIHKHLENCALSVKLPIARINW